jgi:hypothetical protein
MVSLRQFTFSHETHTIGDTAFSKDYSLWSTNKGQKTSVGKVLVPFLTNAHLWLNACFMASGVVGNRCSKTIAPASFKTQYALERSPRSNPMVSLSLE